MKYFRLIENLPNRSPLGFGIGAGRWNYWGTPIIYACSVSSLNFLELLSIKGSVVTKSAWQLVELEITAEIPLLEVDQLPKNWKSKPYPRATQEFGTIWAKRLISPVLKIPSCRIPLSSYPEEHNLLINPLHPEFFQKIQIVAIRDVSFEVNQ